MLAGPFPHSHLSQDGGKRRGRSRHLASLFLFDRLRDCEAERVNTAVSHAEDRLAVFPANLPTKSRCTQTSYHYPEYYVPPSRPSHPPGNLVVGRAGAGHMEKQ